MKMQLSNSVVYRIPQFCYQSGIVESWQALLASIAISSPSFHALVKDLNPSDPNFKNGPLYHTVWKYFNRARFRGTPYGSFAGLGVLKLDNSLSQTLTISEHQELHEFFDWRCIDQVQYSFSDLVQKDAQLIANSSYYFIEDAIRYVGRFEKGYELIDIPKDRLTVKILEACGQSLPISTILFLMQGETDTFECFNELEAMLDDQLLISELQPNIIGQDYFQRVGFKGSANSQKYIIADRSIIDGSIDPSLFKHLPSLISKLQQMLPSYKSPQLEQFSSRFIKKFGESEVPLMLAIDPELGVGYGDMDQDLLTDELIEQLNGKAKKETEHSNQSTINLLLPKLITDRATVVDLESLETPGRFNNEPLPNTLSVLCTVSDDLIQLEHIGGATATSLLGRFSLANDEILELAKSMAQIEEEANPGVAFFDVAYLVSGVIDNVNRRKSIYNLQLSILNFDTSAAPLTLNDLMISVRGNEIIIRSKTYNKRLIPRLASAYNYLLSDLPVFRLFCDLQHQGIHKNLYLRLRDRIPNLTYYPRIQYRNIILAPATWLIRLSEVKSTATEISPADLVKYMQEKGIPNFVKTGTSDQTLCFDNSNEADLIALLLELQKQKSLYLEEAIIPKRPVVKDINQKPHLPQLLLSYYHNEPIYKAIIPSAIQQQVNSKIDRLILPGNDWFYFEVYCHPIRCDELLTGAVTSLLDKYKHLVETWFFIRYSENGNHIRLRLKLNDPEYGQIVTASFSTLLYNSVASGIVADLSISTYKREIERYGAVHIENVETHFQKDSACVMTMLRHNLTSTQKYKLCLYLALAIKQSGLIEEKFFMELMKNNCDQFAKEHYLKPVEFKQLNTAYQKFILEDHGEFLDDVQRAHKSFVNSFIGLLRKYLPSERPELMGSLFHMHVNRLFHATQRTHELIIYYFITKDINRSKHISSPKTAFLISDASHFKL